LRLGLWTLEERKNRCDLIEVFKMFYGYTEIDKTVLFTLDGNDKGKLIRQVEYHISFESVLMMFTKNYQN